MLITYDELICAFVLYDLLDQFDLLQVVIDILDDFVQLPDVLLV